jgi:hypothetical protein
VSFTLLLRQLGLDTSVTHTNPYLTVGPGRHEAGRDGGTNGNIAVFHDCKKSIMCHAYVAQMNRQDLLR